MSSRKLPDPHWRQGGFTLMEMLISLSLLAVILVFIAGSLSFGRRVWDVSQRMNETADLPVVQAFLKTRLQEAQKLYHMTPNGLKLSFQGQADKLSFVAPMADRLVLSGLYHFELGLEEERAQVLPGKTYALNIRLSLFHPAHLQEPKDAAYERVLLQGIKGVRFKYFGQKPGQNAPSWSDDWNDQENLPTLIGISLLFPEKDPRKTPEQVIEMRLE